MSIAAILIYAFYFYLLAGIVFALWFVFRGVRTMDAGMESASWKLRLLLIPGSMALWPYLWKKYRQTIKRRAVVPNIDE